MRAGLIGLALGVAMATVFTVLLDTARLLEVLNEGEASADGTSTTLVDTNQLTQANGFESDDFNGGTLFMTQLSQTTGYTTVNDEDVGQVTLSRTMYGKLLNTPVRPGSVTVTTSNSGASQTDDGHGILTLPSYSSINNLPFMAGSGPWSLQMGNIKPGSLIIKETGISPDRLYSDNGSGQLVSATTGEAWATIDYELGIVTLIPSQSALGALALADFQYYTWYGTINYDTGEIWIRFSTEVTTSLAADYQYGYGVFLPMICRVTGFDVLTSTVTFEPQSTYISTSAGDAYGIMGNRYPKYLLFQKLREALHEIKAYLLDQTDIPVSTLTQNEYALADTVRIHSIWNGNLNATPRDWTMITRYRHVNGRLQFYDHLWGDTVRIKYFADVPEIVSEITELPSALDGMWLAYEAAVKCARWRLFQPGSDEKQLTMQINDLMSRRDRQKAKVNIITAQPAAFRAAILPEC